MGFARGSLVPPKVLSLVEHPDLPMMTPLRRVLGLHPVMIFTRISESIFFQENKMTAYKVKDGKEVASYPLKISQISQIPANICWSSRRLEDVFKTCLKDVFSTSSA